MTALRKSFQIPKPALKCYLVPVVLCVKILFSFEGKGEVVDADAQCRCQVNVLFGAMFILANRFYDFIAVVVRVPD
jgi:hypothetical protein